VTSTRVNGAILTGPALTGALRSDEPPPRDQTPLWGPGAAALRAGDRVWFRHAKAGEVCEHGDVLHARAGDTVIDEFPTYRGEGRGIG
jgi:D-serine deaminase-like pyridoxal phosphate-dependent protein